MLQLKQILLDIILPNQKSNCNIFPTTNKGVYSYWPANIFIFLVTDFQFCRVGNKYFLILTAKKIKYRDL